MNAEWVDRITTYSTGPATDFLRRSFMKDLEKAKRMSGTPEMREMVTEVRASMDGEEDITGISDEEIIAMVTYFFSSFAMWWGKHVKGQEVTPAEYYFYATSLTLQPIFPKNPGLLGSCVALAQVLLEDDVQESTPERVQELQDIMAIARMEILEHTA